MAESENRTPDVDSPGQPSWRRRIARILLLLGVALGLTQLLPNVPREQNLVFRLGDDLGSVRRLQASFTPDGDQEAVGGVTLSFDSSAPSRVRHRVSLPNGLYRIDVEVVRETASGKRSHTEVTRRVRLEGTETVISVEPR